MYHESKGVSQDFAEAMDWYRQSAEQGFTQAQFNLRLYVLQRRGRFPRLYCCTHLFDLADANGQEHAEKPATGLLRK